MTLYNLSQEITVVWGDGQILRTTAFVAKRITETEDFEVLRISKAFSLPGTQQFSSVSGGNIPIVTIRKLIIASEQDSVEGGN